MKKRLAFALLLYVSFYMNISAQQPKTSEHDKTAKMEWWHEARFGMFIHWGIYSIPAGFYEGKSISNSGEWIMNKAKIPLADYKKYANQFNPSLFDAKSFVALAKEAGMKYMIITSKHHDGFSMFGSKSNPFNVVDATPFKRDILKELSKECQKQGIKFGFYYSQAQDWSHPGGLGNNWDKVMPRVDNETYVREKAIPEVKQLLTEYGPIGIFWWDTPRQMSKAAIDSLYLMTQLQKDIITNDRLGEGRPGDYVTFERGIPKQKPDAPYWEICQPISASWGYRSDDTKFQSGSKLIQNLIDIASKGGNYLLNVSPTDQGILKPEAVERLKMVGKWMSKNNEAIYDTEAGPCALPDWGRITMKTVNAKAVLYLHVFNWPKDGKLPVMVTNKVESCYLLTNKNMKFKTSSDENGIVVELKGDAPDSVASVIVLNLVDLPEVIYDKKIEQESNGSIYLSADRAQYQNLDGPGAEYIEEKRCIGSWTSEKSIVSWTFIVKNPGKFDLFSEIASSENTKLTVSLGSENTNVEVPPMGDYNNFRPFTFTNFTIEKAGEYTLTFKPTIGAWNPIYIRSVELRPVK